MRGIANLTADNNVFESSCDCAVALLVEGGFVACLQPQGSIGIGHEGLGGLFGVVPVAFGKLVAGHEKLSSLSNGDNVALGVDDLRASVWKNLADSSQTSVDTIRGERVEASWGCLGKTVAAGIFGHVQFFEKTLHQWTGNWSTGNNTSA